MDKDFLHTCVRIAANRIKWQQSTVTLVLVSCETHIVSFSLYCLLTNVFSLSNVKHPSLLWNHDAHSAQKNTITRSPLSSKSSDSIHFFLSLPPSFLSSETTATSTHNKKLLLPISEAKTEDPTCNKESSQNLDLICAQWGFWLRYVQFFWKSGFRYVAKSIGFFGDFFFFFFICWDFGFLLFGCQENI